MPSEKTDDMNRCMYVNVNSLPMNYPATPGAGPTAVAGHANVDEWGNWVTIIPFATIDAEWGNYFDVESIQIEGITANSVFYFELQYNSITVGRGFITVTGTGARAMRGGFFKFMATLKVAGQDLKMRIMSDQAGESVDVDPIMWCSGTP